MRLLFTGGGGAGTQALWSLLSDRYDIHFADAQPRRIHPSVPRSHAHDIPFAADPAFVDAMRALCHRLGVDLLVPGVDEELLALSERAHDFTPATVMLPDPNFVGTMLDKLEFARSMLAASLDVPLTYRLDDAAQLTLPCIVKPRSGRGSRDVSVVSTHADLLASAPGRGADFVKQELLHGTEYTVQVVTSAAGSLRAIVPARVMEKRGITISAITDPEPAVIRACERFHAHFGASGLYNIQGIRTPDGMFLPFEVNPRISTTTCLAVAAGVDPFAAFMREGEDSHESFRAHVRLDRYWGNEFTDEEAGPSWSS